MTSFLSFDKGFVAAKSAGVLVEPYLGTLWGMDTKKDPFAIEFGSNLRAAMEAASIPTAAALATMMNMGDSRARNWCNGTSTPTSKEAVALARLLGVTLDWLFRGVADGLVEAKRIRVVAAKSGFSPPPALDDREVDEAFSAAEVPVRARRRGRPRTKAIVS